MLNGKSFLAIIPARGGSKRLPRKNVLDLAGKPLITWTLEAARNSKYIDKIIVSSDDTEILQIADDLRVDIVKRPEELASDTATTVSVIEHVLQQNLGKFDFIVLLQPTSPLRNADHIDEAIELLAQKNADAIISVCETEHSPLWTNTLPEDGSMNFFLSGEVKNIRSQDLPQYFRLNGAIYIISVDMLNKCHTLLIDENSFAYKMTISDSVDIDTQLDFNVAEIQLNTNKLP
jgi:CMP-N,N'-diacetyllegionaminic acid synthase